MNDRTSHKDFECIGFMQHIRNYTEKKHIPQADSYHVPPTGDIDRLCGADIGLDATDSVN